MESARPEGAGQSPESRVLRVSLNNLGAGWKLVIIGFTKSDPKRAGCLYESSSPQTLDEALQELSDWRKGVIII